MTMHTIDTTVGLPALSRASSIQAHGAHAKRLAIAFAVSLSIAGVAQADESECEYTGSVGPYVSCIAGQAFDALTLALDNAVRLDAVEGVCPEGFESIGPHCIDLTCRGVGEAEDTDIEVFADAENRCEELGGRLCTYTELADTMGAGCGFTYEFQAADHEGITAVFLRGSKLQADGTCVEPTPYQGDFYAEAYDVVDQCQHHMMKTNDDDNIDGFVCCAD